MTDCKAKAKPKDKSVRYKLVQNPAKRLAGKPEEYFLPANREVWPRAAAESLHTYRQCTSI